MELFIHKSTIQYLYLNKSLNLFHKKNMIKMNDLNPIVEYLKMVQNIITRLANNSFKIRTGAVVLFIVGLISTEFFANMIVLIIAIVFLLLIWYLDSYYLYQERLFRKLYNKIVNNIDKYLKDEKEFILFNMNISEFKNNKGSLIKAMVSTTEILFYLPIIVFLLILLVFTP